MEKDTPQPFKPSKWLLDKLFEAKEEAEWRVTGKNPSYRKKGPGRKHAQGKKSS